MSTLQMASAMSRVSNVSSKLSNATDIESQRSRSRTSSTVEEPEKEEEEEEGLMVYSCENFMKDPCLFIPLIFLNGCCWLGFIGFIVCLPPSDKMRDTIGLVLGLCLVLAGLVAAYEVRAIGPLATQINLLKAIRKQLQEETGRLGGQVDELAGEIGEMKETIGQFDNLNDQLRESIEEYDHQNKTLTTNVSQLEEENSELKENIQGLHKVNDELDETTLKITEQNDELQDSLKSFDELRGNLEDMAASQSQELGDLISTSLDKFNEMDDLFHQNEVVLLNQLAADVEGLDSEKGLNKQEFTRFMRKLPKRYREKLKKSKQDLTFESMDLDSSGIIDAAEVQSMVEELITVQSMDDEETGV